MSPDPAAGGPPDVPGYELLEMIAVTGTAELYRALSRAGGREVAVKVPRPGLPHPWVSRQFCDGARLMASLAHPGIPPVHEIGELADGRPFVAMDLIRGPTLAQLLEPGPPPPAEFPRFVGVFRAVADAAGFAHSRGVIHRNIKPRNVLVGEAGGVQLFGWGLAAAPGQVTQEELRRHPPDQGVVLGTAAYLPPEQARGNPADERSDVFGLGGVLCEILTGAAPFRPEGNVLGLVRAAAEGDLSDAFARLDACGADPRLVALCRHCLAPAPADRPADGCEVAEYADRILSAWGGP